MTEKEKCKNGLPYNPNFDETLIKERNYCKSLCQEYNTTEYSNTILKEELLKKILPNTKTKVNIEPPFWCDYGYNVQIGKNFFSNHNLVILDCTDVTIGDNVFVGPNCGFYTANHPLDPIERNKGIEYAKPINIGDNVWIGGNVIILPGVTIGNNSIIGAGSVVTKNIPDNVIAVGNPCKIIKEIN